MIVKIRAALEKCDFLDIFSLNGTIIPFKKHVVKDYLKDNFKGFYSVSDINSKDKYYLKETRIAFSLGLLYKLTSVTLKSENIVILSLRKADKNDFFETRFLKPNVIFYIENKEGLLGPYFSTNFTNNRIYDGLDKGLIFIPFCQTFEKYKTE